MREVKLDSSKMLMDCHADKSARNDRNQNLATTQDSKICDEKSLLCKPCAEIRLGCLSHKRGAAIKDLSRKAESTNPKANAKGVENA